MTEPAIPGLTRHYVTVGRRQLHYRRAGSGPPLIALHRLPRSSEDLEPFILSAADRFTVIAPDLAGYGQSFALDEPPDSLDPLCDDLGAFLDALGLGTVALYGEQAGAALALSFAHHAPTRVSSLAAWDLDLPGALDLPPSAKAPLPSFEPQWDGSHLAWLWAMLREQSAFHPWHTPALNTRVDSGMPSPRELQRRMNQFLSAGKHGRGYETGYNAARTFNAVEVLNTVSCPALVVARQRYNGADPWRGIASTASDIRRSTAGEQTKGETQALSFLTEQRVETDTPPPPQVKPIAGVLWRDYVSVDGGQLHFQCNTDADTVPLLVQHDAASSVGTVEPITQSFVGKRAVFAFDMPGSGQSDRIIPTEGVEVDAYANVLSEGLDNIGLDQIDFYGMWGGGFVGLELALNNPEQVRRLIMSNVFQHTDEEQVELIANYTPDVSPVWHGGHLLQCWHQMRDQGIYYPWFKRERQGVIWREPFLATDMVHERVCSLLKAGNMYRTAYHAHFTYPTYEKLSRTPVPTLLATAEWDPNNSHTRAASEAAPKCEFQILDEDFYKWGESFLPFLERK
ncbi:MAG: alpha/beta hydrolase [Rhodospirillaceae bacterium]|jgi:pimeloyl-ACP methyl ester carboxylesterase|nr:alpha/beta hydrolase [Rhodospirillaceae bacterium]MBT5564956.1 alpha/beta hydrolase [Rhodospirillaceae bacterium]MBT6090502.1 alpha/beta hydrolase [Rhodospirillaceae bacterium]MBT6961834.1 alpha/beta hydrolase [Rhodospirillaceae bacterium]MBT7450282.1 alpha/beta hydrolase [Rhodospirillaceae bacterium]